MTWGFGSDAEVIPCWTPDRALWSIHNEFTLAWEVRGVYLSCQGELGVSAVGPLGAGNWA